MNFGAALDILAHQRREDLFGRGDVFELHLQQRAALRIHRRLPELRRGHLAQALVALDLVLLAALLDDVLEDLARRLLLDRDPARPCSSASPACLRDRSGSRTSIRAPLDLFFSSNPLSCSSAASCAASPPSRVLDQERPDQLLA
jgi:hypothetical protein